MAVSDEILLTEEMQRFKFFFLHILKRRLDLELTTSTFRYSCNVPDLIESKIKVSYQLLR